MNELSDERLHGRAGSVSGALGPHAECAYVHDLTAGFAFGALDPDDERLVEQHCDRCPPCSLVIDQARHTASLLSFAVPPSLPPAHVKANLFSRIAATSRAAPAVAAPSPGTTAASTPAPFLSDAGQRAGTTRRRQSFPRLSRPWEFFGEQRRPNWQAIALPLATVPLVLALAIVGGFAITTQSRLTEMRDDLARVQGENERLRSTVDTMDGFVTTENARVYDLPRRDDGASTGGHGKVVVNPGTTEAMLLVWNLPSTSSDAGYQVLLENEGGELVSAGSVQVDANGKGATVLQLDEPFTTYEAVHVMPMGRPNIGRDDNPGGSVDALVAQIDPNVGELLDTDPPRTR